MILLIEALKVTAVKGFSDLSGQIVIEIEVVRYREAHSERFLRLDKVTDV